MNHAALSCLLVLALATTIAPTASPAQPLDRTVDTGHYRVLQWTTAQGLPQNTINDIVLLPNGELWLATFGGLARFDGHRFHVLDVATDEGLPANRVIAVAPDGDDSFWFLTQQGHLGRVQRGLASTRLPPASPVVDAIDLSADAAGNIHGKLVDGSVWRTDGTRPWRRVFGSSNSGGMLHAFAVTEQGEFWAGWGARLVRLRDETAMESVGVPATDPDMFPRTGGGLWLGLPDGLGRVVNRRFQLVSVTPRLDTQVTVVETASDGALWVATSGQVSRLDRQPDGSWRALRVPLGVPPGAAIRSMKADAAGSLWVGTNGYGLLRVDRHEVRRTGAAAGLAEVTALAPDGEGGAYASGGCRGLFHIQADGITTPIRLQGEGDAGGPPTECGISLAAVADGGVWARASTHLFLLGNRGRQRLLASASLPNEEGPIVADASGALWVASRQGLVMRLSRAGGVLARFELRPPLASASLGPDGALWLGGDGEVFRVAGDTVERFGQEIRVPRGLVRDILADADGTVWIASYGGGIGRLRAGRVARVTVAAGLPDNSVSRILDDGRGRLWISTNRGLAVTTRDALDAAADHDRPLEPVVLGPERGVAEANFGRPAGFADASGWLWFGTIDGAVAIDAAAFPSGSAPPVVRIEALSADGQPVRLEDVVRVAPLTSRVHVEFSSFTLRHPERARFRFRAEGLDREWVDGGSQPRLDWTPPGPGRHRLLIEARNEDGIWSASPAVVVIDVPPAWWQTLQLRTAVVVGAVLAALGVFRLRVKTIERRHAERLHALEQQRQVEERVAGLRAQLEHVARVALAGELTASLAHEVSQPIGAIVNNAEAGRRQLTHYLGRPEELDAILGDIVADGMRASEVVRGLRGFLRPQPSGVGPVDLSAVVREVLPLLRRELDDNRVVTALALPDGLPRVEGQRVQLGQVVMNLVMNACEALAGKAGGRQIAITTAARHARVELTVRDNGPGVDEAVVGRLFEPFVTTKPGGLGMGLAICRAIAEAHGGQLTAEPAPGGGFQVTLSLPAAPERSAP